MWWNMSCINNNKDQIDKLHTYNIFSNMEKHRKYRNSEDDRTYCNINYLIRSKFREVIQIFGIHYIHS